GIRGFDVTGVQTCALPIYVLDIDRFKTKKIIDYFERIATLRSKWKFSKLQAEVTVAQVVIVEAIKDYVKQRGLTLSIIEYRPSKIGRASCRERVSIQVGEQ